MTSTGFVSAAPTTQLLRPAIRCELRQVFDRGHRRKLGPFSACGINKSDGMAEKTPLEATSAQGTDAAKETERCYVSRAADLTGC
jgi:hypothetical protein